MRRFPVMMALVALAPLLPVPIALGQAGVATAIEKRFEAVAPPAQAEVMQVVLDFAPGAWTPVHTHGGPVYVTVINGEMTLRMGGVDRKLGRGEGWIDSPDEPHAAGNDGSSPARLVAAFVLPKGAAPTTVVETGAQAALPPGPTTVAQFRMDAPGLPAPMDVIQRVIDIAPGATVPMHTHPGPSYLNALSGSLALHEAGTTRSYQAGDNWVEGANVVHGVTAIGPTPVRVVSTTFAPRGAPVSAPAPAPAQVPRTR